MENKNSYEKASSYAKKGLQDEAAKIAQMLGVTFPRDNSNVKENLETYSPNFSIETVYSKMKQKGMNITRDLLFRYHLSLINKGFVILSGISGIGKTWITELYSEAINAEFLIIPVAPNWTSNEDLLGFFNPLDNQYKHTSFSLFLIEAYEEYVKAKEENRVARPYHLVLDEMNLARTEYYFAKFLSLMEVRSRKNEAIIEFPPDKKILIPPNLYFIGTINVDETTYGFADKIYDRAQLIELVINREDIVLTLGDTPYSEIVIEIWDEIFGIAPFAYRVINDMHKFIEDANELGMEWKDALDIQLLQKVLPKIKGTDMEVGTRLERLNEILERYNLTRSQKKVVNILERYANYGVASYF